MPVRKVGERWLVDIRYQNERIRVRGPGTSKADAQAHETYLRGELATHGSLEHLGAPKAPATPTFGDFAEQWMSTYPLANNNRSSEVANKRSILRVHLLPAFGRERLDAVSGLAIDAFRAACARKGLSPKTINNVLTVLHCMLTSAVKWELLAKAPAIDFARIRTPDFRYLSDSEATRLLEAASDPMWRAAILLGLQAGLRWGEIAALAWDDVDSVARQLTIRHAFSRRTLERPKNGRIRYLRLTAAAAAALDALPRLGRHVLMLRGRHVVRETALLHLKEIARRAGLKPHGWHVLRHSFASHLVQRGVPLAVIKELLGHASLKMTERYAHLTPRDVARVSPILSDAVDLLEAPPPNLGHSVGTRTMISLPSVRDETSADLRNSAPVRTKHDMLAGVV